MHMYPYQGTYEAEGAKWLWRVWATEIVWDIRHEMHPPTPKMCAKARKKGLCWHNMEGPYGYPGWVCLFEVDPYPQMHQLTVAISKLKVN